MRLEAQDAPAAPAAIKNKYLLWAALLGLFLAGLLYYDVFPFLTGGLSSSEPVDPQQHNLAVRVGSFLNITISRSTDETLLYSDWIQVRKQIQLFHLAPWYSADQSSIEQSGRELLSRSTAPLLYPLSLIFYLPISNSLFFFYLIHFWLFGAGLLFLLRRLRRRWYWIPGLMLLIPAGTFDPGLLAATAWLPWGMLFLTLKGWTGRLFYGVFCGLFLLAANFSAALILTGLLTSWGLGYEIASRRARGWNLINLAGIMAVMFVVGAGLAAPQLLPRLAYEYSPAASRAFSPQTYTIGLYFAFLSAATVAVSFTALGFKRFYKEDTNSHPARRIAKNSVTPLFAQLFGKGLDFGFAIFSLRLLGPEGNGNFTIATTTWLILATLTDFGLETIVTREGARDKSYENTNRLFFTMLLTRLGLALFSLPLMLLYVGGFSLTGNMAAETSWAIAILMLGFIPSSVSATVSALFRSYEKYEFLAAIQIMTAIIRVPLGLGVLVAGWGVVGLAASSVVVNFVTMIALLTLFRREIIRPRYKAGLFQLKFGVGLLAVSYPLMLNNLINNIFFKSDALLLGAYKGGAEVGLYNSAYKFIDAVLIIPSALTLALFPVFSNYAASSKEELKRAYVGGLRLLLIIGMPISAGMLFVAYDLIGALGGKQYLPGGAVSLQILIWFLPFSYVNGLTQYVLIALNKQRLITYAVIAAALTNISLNLLLIPAFGYVATSFMTIVSEMVLLVPFCFWALRELGKISFWAITWRPLFASGLMTALLFELTAGLGFKNFFITVFLGGIIYSGGLLATRTFTSADVQLFKKIVNHN